jgi:hypothetical protein
LVKKILPGGEGIYGDVLGSGYAELLWWHNNYAAVMSKLITPIHHCCNAIMLMLNCQIVKLSKCITPSYCHIVEML